MCVKATLHLLAAPIAVLALTIGLALAPAHAAPLGTSFTYQGYLENNGTPVSDPVDFRCSLWDSATAGNQFGGTLILNATPVDGIFDLDLDFGAVPFQTTESLWLEVEISDDAGMTWDPLGRQALLATPFSLATRGLTVEPGGNVGIGLSNGETGEYSLHVRDPDEPATVFIQSSGDASLSLMSTFSILTRIYAPANTRDLRVAHEGIGDVLAVTWNGDVGIGTISPTARVDVRDNTADGEAINVQHTGSGITTGVRAEVVQGYGIRGIANPTGSYGVYGQSTNGWGVFSNGRFAATGTKSFVIDHPLAPGERVLVHYSTEAPEPINTYSGTVSLDAAGHAIVTLPRYFDAINTDCRYQLTAIGAAAPDLHVAAKVHNNQFAIAGGPAGLEVSWMIMARRSDAFVQRHGAPIEVDKAPGERGLYLSPELYGQPESARLRGVLQLDTATSKR